MRLDGFGGFPTVAELMPTGCVPIKKRAVGALPEPDVYSVLADCDRYWRGVVEAWRVGMLRTHTVILRTRAASITTNWRRSQILRVFPSSSSIVNGCDCAVSC